MSLVHIYIDESGTMPTQDADPPFTVGAVAARDRVPGWEKITGKEADLLDLIHEERLLPFVGYVIPYPGYAEQYAKRLEDLDAGAQKTRGTTGANQNFYPESGHNARDFVWTNAISMGVGNAVISSSMKGPVSAVDVVIHRKDLKEEARNLVTHRVRNMVTELRNGIEAAARFAPHVNATMQPRLAFTRDTVSVRWSNDCSWTTRYSGVDVADRLARIAYRHAKDGDVTTLPNKLEILFGFRCSADLTAALANPNG